MDNEITGPQKFVMVMAFVAMVTFACFIVNYVVTNRVKGCSNCMIGISLALTNTFNQIGN